jgi:fibronectin-binding autotransporter adhesin
MSQTRRTSHDCKKFIINPNIVRALRIMLPAAIVLAMVWPASAAAISWTNTAGGLWSNSANWSPIGTPVSSSDVLFNKFSPEVTLNTEVSYSTSINSIQYAQDTTTYTTNIAPSILLRILGSSTAPTGSNGAVSLWAGAAGPDNNSISQTLFTGGGQMDISSATGGSTQGDIVVRETQLTAGNHIAVLDLSGLASLNANVDQVLVGFSSGTGSADRPNGTLYLAQHNTITMNDTSYSTSGTNIREAGLIVGYTANGTSGDLIHVPECLYLGQTNVLNLASATIAGCRATATMTFNPAFVSSTSTPTLTMRGIDGGDTRVGTIVIGDNWNDAAGKTNNAIGVMDLTGGVADIKADTIILGRNTQNSSSCSKATVARGTLTFNAGTIDVNTLTLGYQSAVITATAQGYGRVNVNGTANLVVNTGMELGHVVTTGSSTPVEGTLNIRNSATVTMGGDILDGGITPAGATTTIYMSGGTLNMQGHNIGNSSVPIDTFTANGGTVTNLGVLTTSTFKVNTNYSLSSGTLAIASSGLLDMRNTVANTLNVGTLALPSGTSTMYFEVSGTAGSGNDQISINTLNLNSGTTSIKVSPLSATFDSSAPYHLIHYTSETGTGGTFTVSNTTRNAMSVSDNTTTQNVDLTVTYHAPLTLAWSGAVGSSTSPSLWDWATTKNWNTNVDMYYDLDTVTFQTNTGGPSFVKLQNTYSGATAAGVGFYPGSVTVSSDSDYTFTANTANVDRISGTTGLTKSGTGTLTISLSNDYTGATNLNAGRIVLGNNAALGSASAALTIANNSTLDLNTYQLFAKPITVQGAGTDGNGAIINSNTSTAPGATQYDASNITLSGDTTIGGTSTAGTINSGLPGGQYIGRWSIRANSGTATINTTATAGNHYTLTKVGNNQIMLVNVAVASSVGDVNVNMGVLGLEGTTNLGDPAYTVTVDGSALGQPSGGSILQMNNLSVALDKKVVLKNNGQLYALPNSADTSTTNTVSGSVAIDDTGGILNAGGVRADYAANSSTRMTISGAISGSSAAVLAKNGPGTITLSGANTFSGMTNLNDGTLIVNSALPGLGINMATGTVTTTLAGTGTVGGTVTDASGVVISPGSTSAAGSVGTLNFGGLALTGGGQINLDISTDPLACDLINITGNLSIAGTTQIAIPNISTLASNTYCLMKYTGTLTKTGSIGLLNIPPSTRRHFDVTYVTNTTPTPSQVNFSLSGSSASLVWTGNADTTSWDVVATQNWLNSGTSDKFYNLDNVTFDDSSANQAVTLYNDVAPGSITVDTAKTYTITGLNKITGTTGLTKSGSGTLILANGSSSNNDFSGPILINLGTLQVGDGSASNVLIGNGSATNTITNNGQLVFNQTESHTVANVISGTGAVEQKGAGTLTLSGSNTYDGITTITSGTLQAGNSTALGSSVGGTTIKDGATLDVNNMNLGNEIVTVQGKGVGSNGAIVNNNMTTSTTAQNALRFVVLTGDTWLGGQAATDASGNGPIANSGRWEIRGVPATSATISTNGQPYSITKVGNNQVSFVRLTADTALADINIGATVDSNYVSGGVLDLIANTSVGDPTKTINVLGYGSTLQLEGLTIPLAKNIQIDGGILYALNNSTATDNTVLGAVTITDNGGTINTGGIRASDVTSANAGASITINGVLSGSSAAKLTKMGPGTLTLTTSSNASTFLGKVYHNDGTLIVNGPLAGDIIMSASSTVTTTLAGNGTISGAVSDYYSTLIAPGATAAAGSVGTLNFGSLTLGASGSGKITLDLSNDPGNGKNDLINVNGLLDVSGGTTNVTFNVISGYLLGSVGGTKYPLIHYATLTGGAGNFALPTIDSRQTYSIVNDASAHNIDLLVTGAVANLTWVGSQNAAAWDVKTTLNWSGADSKFWTADQVLFDDSSANLTVNIAPTTVMPGTITVSSGHNYIFAGTGNISGGTSLTKSGTGSLTINTSNDYSGPTTINQGTIILGAANALGNATGAITINGTTGGTLDLNVQQLYAKPIIVQGAGVGGHGAIVNNNTTLVPAGTQYDVSNVTLSGNTTIGGTSTLGATNSGLPGNQYVGRWSLRAQSGVTAVLSTSGNAYTLTKVGNNQIMLVNVTADTALGNVYVNEGVLGLEGTTALGTSSTITVNGTALGQPAGGSILQLRNLTVPVSQNIALQNNGQIYALLNSATTDNVVTGAVTIASTGGQFNAGGVRDDYSANPNATMTVSGNILGTGSLACPGPGTVIITSPTVSFSGNTTVNSGTLQINSPVGASVVLHAVSGGGKLGIGDGTIATSVTADSVNMNTVTIGAGATLTIAAIPGGPLAGFGSIAPVPEPSTWAMLMLAAMGLGIYWRRR